MSVVKDKKVLCQIGLADFSVESVNEVPFYKRYYEFCKLFASKVPSVDFELCFTQPLENNAKKTIEWFYVPGAESPVKLTELKETDEELYEKLVQQRKAMGDAIRAALAKANENEQKYLTAVLTNFDADYVDSITYSYDGHILFGIWGMRTKTGRQIDSVIKEDVQDHRAYKVTYHVKGDGRLSPFSSINRRYGHVIHGDKDIPHVIPGEGFYFKEWIPEAPHGKEVKSDLEYTAVCEKEVKPEETTGGVATAVSANEGERISCHVRFNAGEQGQTTGRTEYEKFTGEHVLPGEVPTVMPKAGFRFVGWDKNPNDYVVNGDTEFVAQYEPLVGGNKPFEVLFKPGKYGTLQGQTRYEKAAGERVLSGEVPRVEPEDGYRFIGWDKNPNDYVVNGDTEFVAQYEEIDSPKGGFWGWGWLNWLLALLLLGLIGLLLWYLFGNHNINFCGCNCESVVVPFDTTDNKVPCGVVNQSGGDEGTIRYVSMGQTSGTFLFEFDTYSVQDRITVYNGKRDRGTPIYQYEGGSSGVISEWLVFNSSDGYITVKVEGVGSGTAWKFTVNCPDDPPTPPTPVTPPVHKSCEDAQTRAGKNAPESFVFDMGQQGGKFDFVYNTGASISDLILIRDGDASGPVIFRYDGVSSGDLIQEVKFTKSTVYVEVHPSNDSGTIWEFTVNCPK